ncbi:DUF448 domain-containing protein [Erythrobacter sanguineus]|uniref:YlxR domain-containing protein n=1 Tax=Erythrobacter sanguineus TaxID=198312 RepID=A0A1M7T1N0_9SPHN|nr:DUF448 domain-containing protein [Erythrobacter sanguineus]SHN64695.1 hypothetical protein SAMN02745193_02772 [Erythrobacter sanguineus]
MRTPPNERLTSDIAEPVLPDTSGSERRCILSGDNAPRDMLVRLAISPDGLVLPDVAAKAPGRGAWIGVSRAALETALTEGHLKRALMRAFKGASLSIPDDLGQRVEAALARHLGDRLGLELRSGKIVLGSARIEEQARAGRLAALLHAADSSEDGRRKLDQAWRVGREAEGSGERGQVLPLDRNALSVALGRDNVVHLGVAGHAGDMRAAMRVQQAVSRLSRFVADGGSPPDAAAPDARDMMDITGRDTPGHSDRPTAGRSAHDEYGKD